MNWGLQAQIDRLYRRTLMMIAPSLITATDDTGPIHKVQMRVHGTPETLDNVGVMQIYGLASHAPPGTDATAIFLMGHRDNPVVVATGNQQARLRNQEAGEVSLYSNEGDAISLKRNNQIAINTKDAAINGSNSVTLSTPTAKVTDKLILAHDPGAALEAATRQYVDAGDGALRAELAALAARIAGLEAGR